MLPTRSHISLALCFGTFAAFVPAHADQVLQPGITVRARDIDVNGNSVVLSGDVLIAATPDQRLVLKSQKGGLLVKFSDIQNRTVTISPFDAKSETVTMNPDGMTMSDRNGNSVTILTSGKLPELPPTPAVTSTTPPAPPTTSTAPVSVTIVQTPPAPDQPEPRRKKERYVDPVTDRGAVIP